MCVTPWGSAAWPLFADKLHEVAQTSCREFDVLCFPLMQCDVENPQVDQSVLDGFCKKHNIAGWYVGIIHGLTCSFGS